MGKTQAVSVSMWERILLLMPPEVLVPPARLETLVEQALEYQMDKCQFHNAILPPLKVYNDTAVARSSCPSKPCRGSPLTPMRSGTWHFLTTGSGSRREQGRIRGRIRRLVSGRGARAPHTARRRAQGRRRASRHKRRPRTSTVRPMIPNFLEFERTETGGVFAVVSGRFVRRGHRGQRRVRVERRDGRPARHVRGRPRVSHHRGGVVARREPTGHLRAGQSRAGVDTRRGARGGLAQRQDERHSDHPRRQIRGEHMHGAKRHLAQAGGRSGVQGQGD